MIVQVVGEISAALMLSKILASDSEGRKNGDLLTTLAGTMGWHLLACHLDFQLAFAARLVLSGIHLSNGLALLKTIVIECQLPSVQKYSIDVTDS